jgi:uncharacterized Zn-finger protein
MMAQQNSNVDIQLPLIFIPQSTYAPVINSSHPDLYRYPNYQTPYYLPPVYKDPAAVQQMIPPPQQYRYQQPQMMQSQQYVTTQSYGVPMQPQFQSPSYISQNHPQMVSSHNDMNPSNARHSPLSKEPLKIDYSSLVSYTVSPSLKRKRRKKSDTILLADAPCFQCEVCSKTFQKPYNLKSHMKTHSTEKPYKCSKCNKLFARSHDKKRHELLHDGVKNFKCEGYLKDGVTTWGCGKKFARSDALSRHFRTETGWLCILPLMDEAKQLEEAGDTNEKEFIENSNLIKKLIQGK